MFWVAQAAQILDGAQPRGLADIGGVGRRQGKAARDRPYQPRVAVDQLLPGSAVAVGGRRDELGSRSLWHGKGPPGPRWAARSGESIGGHDDIAHGDRLGRGTSTKTPRSGIDGCAVESSRSALACTAEMPSSPAR